jgi:nitrogen-specific signal transduction histidine kinase
MIDSGLAVAAILAPSFPAAFPNIDYGRFVAALRRLGFSSVHEVGFGADLVANAYGEFLEKNRPASSISTTCPSVVAFVEKYHPELIPHLIPIASPMIAMARVVRKIYGNEVKIVFIGPCIAKKSEKDRADLKGEVNEVMTFLELEQMFVQRGITPGEYPPEEFDPPLAGQGGLLPLRRGLLQAAGLQEDLLDDDIFNADGKKNFLEALKEFASKDFQPRFLETLSCEGCITGPGIHGHGSPYHKRKQVSQYVKARQGKFNHDEWQAAIKQYQGLDLSCAFQSEDQRLALPSKDHIAVALRTMGKSNPEDQLNCGACGYETCAEHAVAILKGLAENEMCLPYTIETLKSTIRKLEQSYCELKNVKETLNHREKLASMGQLSAGIAHEVNNPLGVVLMYAHILLEQHGQNDEMKQDLEMIVSQANRCKKIVSGLLNFARQSKIVRQKVDLYSLASYCVDSLCLPGNIVLRIETSTENLSAEIDKDQISQVLINLVNNSLDAIGENDGSITLLIRGSERDIIFEVIDSGPGIPAKVKEHIFDPFFTTKQIGKGTGLGLPVSYGIVKMHSGSIHVESNADPLKGATWTKVIVSLPRYEAKQFDSPALPGKGLSDNHFFG